MKKIILSVLVILVVTLVNVKATVKKITVGTNAAYAPFEFVDTKGNIAGFDIDLIKAVAKQAGYTATIKDMDFNGLIPSLLNKQIDVIAAGLVVTEERSKKIDFSQVYASEGLIITTTKDNKDFKSLDDLNGLKIGAEAGTTSADLAKSIKNAEVVEFDAADIFVNLSKKKVDAIIQTDSVALYYIKNHKKSNLKITSENVNSNTNDIAFGVNKDNKELLEKLNKALTEVKKNGTFKKIYDKWFSVK